MGAHARQRRRGRGGDYNIKPIILLPDAGPVSIPARGRHDTEHISRRFKNHKQDLIKHGYQQGCLGCKMAREGKPAQSHNVSCRNIIEDKLNQYNNRKDAYPYDNPQEQRPSDKWPSPD